MANNDFKILGQGTLTGSGTQDTLYTVPASHQAVIKNINFINYSASAANVKVFIDGNTDAALLKDDTSVPASGDMVGEGTLCLNAASYIKAEASAATSIVYIVTGNEVG